MYYAKLVAIVRVCFVLYLSLSLSVPLPLPHIWHISSVIILFRSLSIDYYKFSFVEMQKTHNKCPKSMQKKIEKMASEKEASKSRWRQIELKWRGEKLEKNAKEQKRTERESL